VRAVPVCVLDVGRVSVVEVVFEVVCVVSFQDASGEGWVQIAGPGGRCDADVKASVSEGDDLVGAPENGVVENCVGGEHVAGVVVAKFEGGCRFDDLDGVDLEEGGNGGGGDHGIDAVAVEGGT
jgi:hypothetical protein